MIRTLAAVLLLAAPAHADPAWEQFFTAPGADVVQAMDGNREAVLLPGPIQLVRTREGATWEYAGIDRSDHGAVGCIASILIELRSIARLCDALFTGDQTARMQDHLRRLAEFYAENAVPQISADAFLAEVDAHAANAEALQCDAVTDGVKALAEGVIGPASDALIDDLLSTPRLPVLNPCL